MKRKRRWSDLSRRQRVLLLFGVAFEGTLKISALRDLRRRPADEIRGSKKLWATALVLANSAGAVPIAYFRIGRRAH
jgi:hypothetical protein